MLTDSSTRLNKYISESGICSRREADRFIEQGNVFINGKRAAIGDQVKPGDVVKVNGQLIEPREADDLVLIPGVNFPDQPWRSGQQNPARRQRPRKRVSGHRR